MGVLRGRGYEVTPQLGVAGYRIDIAVKHPERPGVYLAAIECDGASYHSALSVRDRDRIRQDILENLGWRDRIWRIWSADWFRTPHQEMEKLIQFLDDLHRSWKPEHASDESWVEEGAAVGSNITPLAETTARLAAAAEDRQQQILEGMLQTDDDVEIEVGDLVRYVDVLKPDDMLSVRITNRASDLANGVISENTPLAQALLGALTGLNPCQQLASPCQLEQIMYNPDSHTTALRAIRTFYAGGALAGWPTYAQNPRLVNRLTPRRDKQLAINERLSTGIGYSMRARRVSEWLST
jgi:transcription elongation GreA/GreB family factor